MTGRGGARPAAAPRGPGGPRVFDRFYPEAFAGGFSRVDGTVAFYTRVNALLRPDMTVVDFGAGRGSFLDSDRSSYKSSLRLLRGKVARVIGVDIDPVVRSNPGLDEALVMPIAADGSFTIPMDDASVSLIVSDYTFEHVGDPGALVREFGRVLKPGGWICARTPNRWGYIGLGNALVPNGAHARFLQHLQPSRKLEDVFPTFYRLNDRGTIARLFPSTDYENYSYLIQVEPAYAGNSAALWAAFKIAEKFTPGFAQPVLLVFLRKI